MYTAVKPSHCLLLCAHASDVEVQIVFSVDPISMGVGICLTVSCVYGISCTIGQIFIKTAGIYHWDKLKSCLDFDELDLIFKVTVRQRMSNLSQK